MDERINLLNGWRQSEQVKVESTDKGAPVSAGGRPQVPVAQSILDERIHGIVALNVL